MNTFKYLIEIVKILYPTFIRPHIEFALTVWNHLKKEDLNRLKKFQRKETTYIKYLRHEERLDILGLKRYEDRRMRGDFIQIFKIINNFDDISVS